jgi:uncharacterized protein (DUF1810 family)
MQRQGDEVHIETDEARGGSTPHIVRYVLVIGLFLAIAALSLIWITGALNSNPPNGGSGTINSGLERFVEAQHGVYPQALAELRQGEKRSHWMWFVFPQLAGLGHSEMARAYALADLIEARAYLAHPLLGPRLRESTAAMLAWAGRRSAERVLGLVDALKVRSSMTLFEAAAREIEPFGSALDALYHSVRDPLTLSLLR